MIEKKKDWLMTIEAEVTETVIFHNEVTREKAVELYNMGIYYDRVDFDNYGGKAIDAN